MTNKLIERAKEWERMRLASTIEKKVDSSLEEKVDDSQNEEKIKLKVQKGRIVRIEGEYSKLFFNDADFIYVPSINLYVAKERKLLGSNFYECQEELHKNNEKMLNLYEFKEFLKVAKEKDLNLYNEITEVRSPWRGEWIDADFKYENNTLFVEYHVFENGKIVKKREAIDKNTLMEDKTLGISLENWLENSTKQGFPTNKIKSGNLCYWAPMEYNNSVAWFDAGNVRASLDANGNPSNGGSFLGVRAAKLFR